MENLVQTDWTTVKEPMMEDDARFASDSKLHVQFYVRPMMQGAASKAANRPIFKDVEHIRILVPGDKLSIVDRVASHIDKSRFSEHYARFQAGKSEQIIGTRLEAVPWMTRSKVEEYRYFGVLTVEQLAEANDNLGSKFQGFFSDKERAKKFLEAASGTNARVTELEQQLTELKAMLQQQSKPAVAKQAPAKDA